MSAKRGEIALQLSPACVPLPPILRLPREVRIMIAVEVFRPGPSIDALTKHCCVQEYVASLEAWYYSRALLQVEGFRDFKQNWPSCFALEPWIFAWPKQRNRRGRPSIQWNAVGMRIPQPTGGSLARFNNIHYPLVTDPVYLRAPHLTTLTRLTICAIKDILTAIIVLEDIYRLVGGTVPPRTHGNPALPYLINLEVVLHQYGFLHPAERYMYLSPWQLVGGDDGTHEKRMARRDALVVAGELHAALWPEAPNLQKIRLTMIRDGIRYVYDTKTTNGPIKVKGPRLSPPASLVVMTKRQIMQCISTITGAEDCCTRSRRTMLIWEAISLFWLMVWLTIAAFISFWVVHWPLELLIDYISVIRPMKYGDLIEGVLATIMRGRIPNEWCSMTIRFLDWSAAGMRRYRPIRRFARRGEDLVDLTHLVTMTFLALKLLQGIDSLLYEVADLADAVAGYVGLGSDG